MPSEPFHEGEHAAQDRAGVRVDNPPIRDFMPDQHREFFAALPYALLATADATGGPVATMLTGNPGFLSSPDARTLRVSWRPGRDSPATGGLTAGSPVGILGIDLATRRRNRLNGHVAATRKAGFDVAVQQSFGNCPQYIQLREVVACEDRIAAPPERLDRLDDAARKLIQGADTFFVASTSGARGGAQGGLDMSHRGGRPGFVRVDGNTLLIPDFRGNHYFNTLGNFLLDPRAALLFVDFARGDLLHVQGIVEVIWASDPMAQFDGAERLWQVHLKTAERRSGAVPLRWAFHGFARQTERTGTWINS